MEVRSDRIDVQMVCPGPVVSNISVNAVSSWLDKVHDSMKWYCSIYIIACSKYGRKSNRQNEHREVCTAHAGGHG